MYRNLLRRGTAFLLKHIGINVVNYRNHQIREEPDLVNLLIGIRKEQRAMQSVEELLNIYRLAKSTERLDGDIAEVGVYRGGSARLIAMQKANRILHLFDSFEGMVKTSNHDIHQRGDFSETSLESVERYLSSFENIVFHQGWFPDSARGLEQNSFSFVHLDVDLYQSTVDALAFFYPRLNRGGIILSHDFNSKTCPGVSRAFREFFQHKEEAVIELAGTSQCLVVKS